MSITRQELGDRLRKAREACGLTQEAVATHIHVTRPVVSLIEAGKRSVSSLELDQLAYVLGKDMGAFFRDTFVPDDPLTALFRAVPEIEDREGVAEALRFCVSLAREINNIEGLLELRREAMAPVAYAIGMPANRRQAVKDGIRLAAEERRRLGLADLPVPDLDELLSSQSVHTAQVDLPDHVSGLTLPVQDMGLFVVVNRGHQLPRQRFSLAHEYAHVLMDRERLGAVSLISDSDNLAELRANVFAANFLMPEQEVMRVVGELGKGFPSRSQVNLGDEDRTSEVEVRAEPGSQEIQLYDVALVAHHFGVSRISALFRLKNLNLVTAPRFEQLKADEDAKKGAQVQELMGLPEPSRGQARNQFRHRFVGMALEAFRRRKISRGKLLELGQLVGIARPRLETLLEGVGLSPADDGNDVLIPEGL